MPREQRMSELVSRLGRVRADRNRPDWARLMGGEVERLKKDLGRQVRASGQLTEAWQELAPAELVDRARPRGVSRGTLSIEVDGPAFRYTLERWLKGGGRQALLSRCSASVRRVKVVLRPEQI